MGATRGFLTIAAAAFVLGACAPATEQAAARSPARSNTQLVVQNNNMMDMSIYLLRGSTRTRVGSVTSMTTSRFTIPDAYVFGNSDLTVQVDAVGARKYTLPHIQVFPGAVVSVQIENNVQLSNYSVYSGTQ